MSTSPPNLNIEALLKKIRRIEIVSNRLVDDLFAGRYRAAFRGQGLEFAETREYVPGDDVRAIDWNVTARAGKPFVKTFCEERERSILIALDVSASTLFGSKASRLETAVEIAATLTFSALKSNDKIGLLTFADGVRSYFPPRKGKNNALRLIREAASASPQPGPTDLEATLDFIARTLKRRTTVFLLSDFFVPNVGSVLFRRRDRLDLVAVSIAEPVENAFPNLGFVTLRDPETGATLEIDAGSKRVRTAVCERLANRRRALATRLQEARVDTIFVENGGDYAAALRDYFRQRERRR
ncbi:MAG: DUF58 domain-containing protein [Thermoguttaceae bacterium]|nr:DUF58 domain-containing protein [Thermoguttaceae bacterium]